MEKSTPPQWMEAATQEAWTKAQQIIEDRKRAQVWHKYRSDPLGFITEVLGEKLTDDIIEMVNSVRDNPVTVARSANGVGKTHSAARIALWYFFCFEDAKIFITSAPPLENLKSLLWGEIYGVVQKKPGIFKGFRTKSLEIKRNAQSFIKCVAIPTSGTPEEREAKFSGKHAPHLMFVVDEGDAVPDEVYKGIESCVSGGDTKILILFNPRDKSGPVWQKESNHQANVVCLSALNHPNVLTGENVIPGAVTRDATVRRINNWTRELKADEKVMDDEAIFEVPEFLVGVVAKSLDGREYPPLLAGKRKIEQPEFYYMVKGIYPALGARQLISEVWIANARARWDAYVAQNGERPPSGVQPVLGFDLAEYGSDYNTVVPRYGGFIPSFDHVWAGIDVDESTQKAYDLYFMLNARQINVDANGIGAGAAPSMARRARDEHRDIVVFPIKVSEKPSNVFKVDEGEFFTMRDQLAWMVRVWLKDDPGAMLPNDPSLLEELRIITYQHKKKIAVMSKEEMRKVLKRSPDRWDGLTLTFAPFEQPTWGTLAQMET